MRAYDTKDSSVMVSLFLVAILAYPFGSAMAQPAEDVVLTQGARSPAVSPQGEVAFVLLGDLWIRDLQSEEAAAVQLTSGAAWERDPAWDSEGKRLYFSSNRAGNFDLWRVERQPDGSFGTPDPVTETSDREEREPTVAADETLVFRSGRGRHANLWVRDSDGQERPLTDTVGAERAPSLSPDGRHVVFTAARADGRSLRIASIDADPQASEELLRGPYEHPAWGPDGTLIAFGVRGVPGAVAVTDTVGSFRNQIAAHRADVAWMSESDSLVGAKLPRPDPRYNGDPDRLGERNEGEMFPEAGRLQWIDLTPRSEGRSAISFRASLARRTYNRRVYDRVADRIEGLYFDAAVSATRRDQWSQVRERHRSAALGAESRADLEQVLQSMQHDRPRTQVPDSGRAAVSSAHPRATGAGLEILREGGNVVDAAVAVSFAVGVVEPDASGVGGYGQMVLRLEDMEEPTAIEFLTRVPQAASLENGALTEMDGALPQHGPRVVNVPGTVAGMEKAWSEYGSGEVSWAEVLAPAIRLADDGFVLDEVLPTTLRRRAEELRRYEGTRELFFREGRLLQAGDTLRNPGLAWTLRQIASGGAEAFYEGAVAERIVEDLRGKGNAMVEQDLVRYWAAERDPMQGTYRDHTIYGSAPATTGGATLVSKLQLLDQHEQGSPGGYAKNSEHLHAMIEAWKLAPEARGRIADPGLWPVRRTPFESRDTARARWDCFEPNRAISTVVDLEEAPSADMPSPCAPGIGVRRVPTTSGPTSDRTGGQTRRNAVKGRNTPRADDEAGATPVAPHVPLLDGTREGTGTTGFAVADAEGNVVAVTQTLGTWGGSFYATPGLGFLYNDKLGSYRSTPEAYNARLPFARNATSISPTLVFEGTGPDRRPLLATGAGGNAWITSAVYQVVTGVIDQDLGPQRALEQPRFLVGEVPGPDGRERALVQYEEAFAPHVIETLSSKGHRFQPISLRGELRMGFGAAVKILESGTVVGGGDPRRSGSGGAIE